MTPARHWRLPEPQIAWRPLGLTVLALLPALLCFVLGNDAAYLKQAFVAVYLVIVLNRIGPSATQVLLQAALIAVSILAFILAAAHTLLFVVLCAVYAATAVGIGQWGENWKTLATYTFLPAFYLGCELASAPRAELIQLLLQYPIACLPPWLIALICCWRSPQRRRSWKLRFAIRAPDGASCRKDRNAAWIRLFAVLIAASWVRLGHIEPEKWVIWSSASVSTGERETSLKKHRDRLLGVLLGVPIGLLLSRILPYGPVLYSLCILLIGVSIDTVRNYRLAFGLRGTLCVLAASNVQQGFGLGLMRVEDVILGGMIGLVTSLLWHAMQVRRERGRAAATAAERR